MRDPATTQPSWIRPKGGGDIMVRFRRILRDYDDAGSLHGLLALWGFVDDTTFLTKGGALGVVYRLSGVDFECLDHPERQAIAHRFEQALRLLDESFRVYQYAIKWPAAPIVAEPHRNEVVHAALRRRSAYLTAKAESLFEIDLHL